MFISYFDDKGVSENNLNKSQKKLKEYREQIATFVKNNDESVPEYSLYHCADFSLHETLEGVKKQFKEVKHLVLIGIGGSSLGVEAIHSVLDNGLVKLSVLDTVSAHKIDLVVKDLQKIKKVNQVAVCIISKSGETTETLANAAALMEILAEAWGDAIYQQTICIGNQGNTLMKYAKKKGATDIAIPKIIGGRYSVATAAGLVPLTILGHDVDDFISGYLDALDERYETLVVESATKIEAYFQLKYQHYNFFAFEPRLKELGSWYRQLFAESLGKETDINGKLQKTMMVPTVSTAVELHSVGQLYLSGVVDCYTDFVTFDDEIVDIKIARSNKMTNLLKGQSLQEVTTALYGGVISAYQERNLPYRATIFEESLAYSLGLFMAMRLREIMYVAKLRAVNAFDQPNVELYKTKTKEILSI